MKILTALERNYFVDKVGGALPEESTDSVKNRYFKSLGLDGFSSNRLEISWLRKMITDNGGTPNSEYKTQLWKELASIFGDANNYLSNNKMVVFTNT